MTRAQSATETKGMSLLALMPFPAFNPLNWGALAVPRNALLASAHSSQLVLDAWRAAGDSMRALVRLQQDEFLKLLQAEAGHAETQAEATEHKAEVADSETAAALFVEPMLEATRAYNRVGRAFIVAQRDTLRAFSARDEAH